MKMSLRFVGSFLVSTLIVTLPTQTFFTSPASAACGFSNPIALQSAFTSQTYAGVETTTSIPYVVSQFNAGCLQRILFTFVGGGGVDIQTVEAKFTSSGMAGQVTASWVPKALEYGLTVEVIYTYGSFGLQGSSRVNYKGPLTGAAFRLLPTPSAPLDPQLAGADRNLNVYWRSPLSNSTAVAKYVVRTPTGQVVCELPGTTTNCTISNQPDGAYQFVVAALNQVGAGAESATNRLTIGPPSPPVLQSVRRTGAQAPTVITWTRASDTTATKVDYTVIDQNGQEICGSSRPVVVSSNGVTCSVPRLTQVSSFTLEVETPWGKASASPVRVTVPKSKKTKGMDGSKATVSR